MLRRRMSAQNKSRLDSKYDIHETIGKGTFATVKRASLKGNPSKQVAIKVIDKKSLVDKQEMVLNEVKIMKKVKHDNIIRLLELYETSTKLYLVMEIVTGGELFDRIVAKGSYSERDAARSIKKIASAVEYLHGKGVVHRDLKPENLLYESPDEDADLKVADFGLSKLVSKSSTMVTACGTPGYVAPEVLKCDGYDKGVDCWSIGVILYILLCGFPPFYDDNTAVLFNQIMSGKYDFPSPYWDNISADAKDLIKNLLVVDPTKRLTAKGILKHKWIKEEGGKAPAPLTMVAESMKKFNARKRFRGAVHGIVAANRMRQSWTFTESPVLIDDDDDAVDGKAADGEHQALSGVPEEAVGSAKATPTKSA